MTKVTNQPSGVVAGTLDVSGPAKPDVGSPTDAGAVLSRRKVAATRAKKAARRAKKPVARRVAKVGNSRQKR
ncbi:hypothetical protein JQX13_05295 [Archangium violaceum]|uniref:hypothetical protein n=1 Tax=Archangium violaceum TaxID=83451 RepID=UPI00193C1172|nr:hypothetical protein [Archangium violaceum]QRK09553.1 hypothetical protein JQX13_05295 [Archangium violaceum]